MQENNYHIYSDKIIKPITIALVTDLHGKNCNKVIRSLIRNKLDLITIVGDVINHDNDPYPMRFFKSCAEIASTFFSLGNHERKITDLTIQEIKNIGVVVLDNSWIHYGNIIVGGMTSAFVTEWRECKKSKLTYAIPEYQWLADFESQQGFKLLLDHHPENYERVTRYRDIDLILSGHAHGGQVRILNKGLYAPHQGLLPKYTSGVYENRLVVSRGLSNIKPIPRIGNPTEIVYIEVSSRR